MRSTTNEGSLTVSKFEASRLLGLSERTVHALISRGQLRSVRVGRRVLIPREALAELLRGPARHAPGGEGVAR